MKFLLRFMGWIFAGGTIIFLVGVTATAGLLDAIWLRTR